MCCTISNLDAKRIKMAQKLLRENGSSIKVTGKFSIGMSTALCKYQRDNGLEVTGELDKDTWKSLTKKAFIKKFCFWKK